MLKQRSAWPEGSVNDAQPYEGSLKDYIEGEERWIEEIDTNFHLGFFDLDSMLVPAIFPMVAAVQHKYIHGPDFFGPGIFVEYGEKPEGAEEGWYSHHSGYRLLLERNSAKSVVILSRSNPFGGRVDFLVEGVPPEEWVDSVIQSYYISRRAVATALSRWRESSRQ